jgi:hypothetical protein
MEGCCSTGQSPQWDVVPVEEEDICIDPSMSILKRTKCFPLKAIIFFVCGYFDVEKDPY